MVNKFENKENKENTFSDSRSEMDDLPDEIDEGDELDELPDEIDEGDELDDLPDEIDEGDGLDELPDEIDEGDGLDDEICNEINRSISTKEGIEANEKIGLTDEEKALIKNETGWSDEIIDHIESMEQYEIYKNADLHEVEINGRKCLVKDIDMDYVDPKTGKTNRELMESGKSPIDSKTGEKIELHHMGQDYDSPFAELCENSEHGDGNHSVLHTKTEESWRNNPELRNRYNNVDKPNHWIKRAEER